ncbi:MAG: phosphotransferase [Chloroflexi bacterium]|nr:phosphotransferase [Chloroflexota bacterium]MCI0771406.1 phosphotransferase [Chloroflexota bacterium]MCI0791198.1 phosphotransferase [Chloroflexota bacterium]MCI0840979.1 phosphotransferase [Chloroflexota bacterium]MCI0869472.1 phosphotransferase [Chloroflexota bacterium]
MSPNADQSIDIPERYEDVTADWLTQALRAGGVLDGQSVSSFHVEPLSASKSRTSSLARITVKYNGHSGDLPTSMFAKFVSRIPANRKFASDMGLFRREVALYGTLGSSIPLDMPIMYFGDVRENSDIGVLLLQEIDGMSKEGPVEEMSLSPSEAKLALNALSKMHAKWWADLSLNSHTWLRTIDDPGRVERYEAYADAWAKLKHLMEPVCSASEIRICDRLSNYLPGLTSDLKKIPMTLCHGDFHLGNLLWDQLGEPETVWTLDWQGPAISPAVTDVAWFLSIGVPKQDLYLLRGEYLPGYHTALMEGGVTGYAYDRFLRDFKYGLLDGLSKMIWILAIVDLAREDSALFVRTFIGRMIAVAEDAGCGELLS